MTQIRLTQEDKMRIETMKHEIAGLYAGQLGEEIVVENGNAICILTDESGKEYRIPLSSRCK